MKTLTICGSMRFSNQLQQIAWELETRYGFNILQCVYGKEELDQAAQERLKSAHYRKIELSDGYLCRGYRWLYRQFCPGRN